MRLAGDFEVVGVKPCGRVGCAAIWKRSSCRWHRYTYPGSRVKTMIFPCSEDSGSHRQTLPFAGYRDQSYLPWPGAETTRTIPKEKREATPGACHDIILRTGKSYVAKWLYTEATIHGSWISTGSATVWNQNKTKELTCSMCLSYVLINLNHQSLHRRGPSSRSLRPIGPIVSRRPFRDVLERRCRGTADPRSGLEATGERLRPGDA